MNTLFVSLFLFSFLASTTLAQGLSINSISGVTTCVPVLLTWAGGVSPYDVMVLPESPPNANALVDFLPQTGTSLTWIVNITAGTTAFLQIRDSTGQPAESGNFTVQAGTSTSCINSTSAGTGASTGATTGSPAPSSRSAGLSSSSSTRPATSTGTGAAPSKSSAAAAHHYAPVEALAMTGVAAFVFALVL